jgi:2-phospho-L-lactate guanylyltransferase
MAAVTAGPTPGAGPAPGPAWTVVLPVKRLDRAKTRLSTRPAGQREDLALAFARDVVAAATACPAVARVVVVTDDARARSTLIADGTDAAPVVVPDVPDAGLNPALRHGAAQAAAGTGVAALSADLPALRPDELGRALAAAAGHSRAFVADLTGTGTTLLTAAPGVALDPRFGARSRAEHAASGAVELAVGDVPGLRRDVDTEVDLWDAVRLGVGPHTRRALER